MGQSTKTQDNTDLMNSIIDQNIYLVKALVESGADLEVRNKLGHNTLYFAFPEIFTPISEEILVCLLQAGINSNSSLDGDGCSALVTAVVLGLPSVVQALLEAKADVDEPAASKFWGSLSSDPAYQRSSQEQSTATAQFIFSKGCGHSVTPLLAAVMYRRHDIFTVLLQAGADPSCLSHGTFWRASMSSVCSNCDITVTPLHMAAYIGDIERTFVLLNLKSDPLEKDDTNSNCYSSFNNITPLWFALLQGHVKVIKLFLSLGRPVAMPCHFGSGLQVCLEEGHTSVALMILRAGYELEDDMDWISSEAYPTTDREVIERIESLVNQPRPLLDWCADSLRKKFRFGLNRYLKTAEAPKKVLDILNFNDLSKSAWQPDIQHLLDRVDSIKV